VTYVGEGDSARLVKICHNLFLGVVTQSMAEITVLAEKGGVPRAAFLEFLNNSVMGSVFTRYKTPAFVHLDYTPTFTPVLLRKDFDLGLAAARELDVPMPIAAATAQLVQASVSSGRTSEDFAVLLDQQAASSGIALKPEDTPVDDGLGMGGQAQ
jgi:3-hydroxyisobutyrate dehydrogenase-like beta-hydroxyacid dehydrogenase